MANGKILIIGTFVKDNDKPYPQAELISDLLRKEEYETKCVSAISNKIFRLLEICYHVLFGNYSHTFIQIFSGPAFIYASCAIILGKIRNKRNIGVLRGGNLPNYLKRNKKLKLWLLAKYDTLIAPSAYLKHEFDKLGLSTIIIPNIIELDKYTYKKRQNISLKILWIRRFIDLYNPLMAVNVLEILKERHPNLHLTMAGGGDSAFVRQAAKDKGLSSNLKVLGYISKKKINELGQQHDIFINTTTIDNLPVTVIEAMAMGLVVISTNVGGLPFFLKQNANALLVDSNNAHAMAKQIEDLYQNPELCSCLSESGFETVSKFKWDYVKRHYFELFK